MKTKQDYSPETAIEDMNIFELHDLEKMDIKITKKMIKKAGLEHRVVKAKADKE